MTTRHIHKTISIGWYNKETIGIWSKLFGNFEINHLKRKTNKWVRNLLKLFLLSGENKNRLTHGAIENRAYKTIQ